MESYVNYMRAELAHLRASYENLYNLDMYIGELQMYIQKVRSMHLQRSILSLILQSHSNVNKLLSNASKRKRPSISARFLPSRTNTDRLSRCISSIRSFCVVSEVTYHPLQLLANPDLAVVGAICASAGADQAQTLETLVQILDAYKLTLPIIKIGITKEVSGTGSYHRFLLPHLSYSERFSSLPPKNRQQLYFEETPRRRS